MTDATPKFRHRREFVSFGQATTVRDAKRHIKVRIPHATDVIGRKADPGNTQRGFIVEFNA